MVIVADIGLQLQEPVSNLTVLFQVYNVGEIQVSQAKAKAIIFNHVLVSSNDITFNQSTGTFTAPRRKWYWQRLETYTSGKANDSLITPTGNRSKIASLCNESVFQGAVTV